MSYQKIVRKWIEVREFYEGQTIELDRNKQVISTKVVNEIVPGDRITENVWPKTKVIVVLQCIQFESGPHFNASPTDDTKAANR